MCVVSFIGDHFSHKWEDQFPNIKPYLSSGTSTKDIFDVEKYNLLAKISTTEWEAFKKDVEEMKVLLKKALQYDIKNNEPHCEMDSKVALLKVAAAFVGVSLEDVFPTLIKKSEYLVKKFFTLQIGNTLFEIPQGTHIFYSQDNGYHLFLESSQGVPQRIDKSILTNNPEFFVKNEE